MGVLANVWITCLPGLERELVQVGHRSFRAAGGFPQVGFHWNLRGDRTYFEFYKFSVAHSVNFIGGVTFSKGKLWRKRFLAGSEFVSFGYPAVIVLAIFSACE